LGRPKLSARKFSAWKKKKKKKKMWACSVKKFIDTSQFLNKI
jgi:hypothetical protein